MFVKSFTDPQGQTHDSAVFEVKSADFNIGEHLSYQANFPDGPAETNTTKRAELQYTMCYWTSQESRDAGNQPYTLSSEAWGDMFFASVAGEVAYEGLSAFDAAEKHCQEVVLA